MSLVMYMYNCNYCEQVILFNVIGEFGVVYKGHLVQEGGVVIETVAIKTLKGSYNHKSGTTLIY